MSTEDFDSGYIEQQHPMAVPDGGATGSMVCGILGLLACPVLSIVGVVLGHIARGRIRRSDGQLSGDGKALAGLITGYLGLVASLALVAFIGLYATVQVSNDNQTMVEKAKMMQTRAAIAELHNALMIYEAENNKYPASLQTLVSERIMNKIRTDGWGQAFTYNSSKGEVWSNGGGGGKISSNDL